MKYHFKYFTDKNGEYHAEGIELKDFQIEADSLEKLKEITQEILDIYLDESPDSKLIFPQPLKKELKGKNIITIKPDPNILFSQILRMLRIKRKLTVEEVSKKMGYKKVWDYLKYEKHKENPTFKTLTKIKNVFPELDLNEIIS